VGFQPNDPGDRRKMVREFKSRRPHHNILGPQAIPVSGSLRREIHQPRSKPRIAQ
jgi:hypothetical protein